MELTTERLILRDFTAGDWPAVLAYQQHPLYLRYYAWTDRTPEDVRAFVDLFLAHQQQSPRHKFQLAVTLKAGGQLIGNCGIRQASPEAAEAEIGYELAPEHWGQGYATEAARAIVRFGFTVLKVHRISAQCVPENTASARALVKLGMQLEGRLREREFYKGRWWDTLVYAVLEPEWREAGTGR